MKPLRVIDVPLEGHLTEASLRGALAAAPLEAARGDIAVIIDCSRMTGYELAARHAFVDWNREHRGRVSAVAVITDNRLWQMVVGAMALASGQRLKAFGSRTEASLWLGG